MHLVLFFNGLLTTSLVVLRTDDRNGDGSVNIECCRVGDRCWVVSVHVLNASDVSLEKRVAVDPATWCKRGTVNISNCFYSITTF